MALILQGQGRNQENESLKSQLQELSWLVAQQTMAIEEQGKALARLEARANLDLSDRLTSGILG